MLGLFRQLYSVLWGVALVLLVLLALYASLGRQYIGLLGRYQSDLFEQVEKYTGVKVQGSSLEGSWEGLSPVIELRDFQLGSQDALHFDRARLNIDVLGSLVSGTVKIRNIDLNQLNLDLLQSADGSWHIPGLATDTDAVGNPEAIIDSVLSIRNASLELFSVSLTYANGNQTQMRLYDFKLESDGTFRRAYAKLNTDSTGDIQLLVEAYGDPRDSQDFNANAYVHIDQSRFSALAPLFQSSAPLIDSLVSGEMWLSWRRGQRISLSGELTAPELAIGVLWGADQIAFQDVNMRFASSHRDGAWRLSFSSFDALWRDHRLDLAGISVRHPDEFFWQFSLPKLDLNITNTLLVQSEALDDGLRNILLQLAPKGDLRNIYLDLHTADSGIDNFQLRAAVDQVEVQAWQGAPGAKGLFGYLEIQPGQGRLLLDTPELSLAFPNLYDKAFLLQNLNTELRWQFDDKRVLLSSGLIRAKNSGVPLNALLRLDLPLHKEDVDDPEMTLVIGVQDVAISDHQDYTPNVLSANLLNWLGESIRDGRANEAGFIYRGSLLAASDQHPSVQLYLDLADIELRYHPDWPSLKADHVELLINNADVTASVGSSATMDGLDIDNIQVRVQPGNNGHMNLAVAASARPDFAQIKKLILETPLHDYVGSSFDNWNGEGDASLDFSLNMVFDEDQKITVGVDSDVDFQLLNIADFRLNLTDVSGHLHYQTDQGLRSRGLRADLFARPVKVKISQKRQEIRVDASSNLAMRDIVQWLRQPALGFLGGNADASLQIRAGGDNPGLRLVSDLVGVTIGLPQPMYKSAKQVQALKINMPFTGLGQRLDLVLAEQLNLQLGFRDGEIFAADLQLGSAPAQIGPSGEFRVGGVLEFATFDQWLNVYKQYWQAPQQFSADTKVNDEDSLSIRVTSLQVNQLDLFDNILDRVKINLQQSDQSWQFQFDSDQVAGSANIPHRGSASPVKVILSKLQLPEVSQSPADSFKDIDPRSLPDVDLDIDHLFVGGSEWGRVGFNMRSNASGAHFYSLRGNLRGIFLARSPDASRLHWLRDDRGSISSRLEGQFSVADLGGVLENLGFSKVIETRSGNFDVDLSWSGAPNQWSLQGSDGSFNFDFKDGRFLKTSDVASGALRILGVFNMANLVRRLQFDFSDVFKKGVSFDQMHGKLYLQDGHVQLIDTLDVRGPASRFQMTGNIDLNTDTPDLRLVATLPVGSNLPWVAALVGGLPAAAGVYVVSKVFKEQMDSFSSAVYDIGGTIQDPELTFKKIFDVNATDNNAADNSANTPSLRQ